MPYFIRNHPKPTLRHTWKCMIFLFLIVTQKLWAAAYCPPGQYSVKAHQRTGYQRSDGTHVSPATVSAYCKSYRHSKPAELKFYNDFKIFSEKEKRKISNIFKKLPSVLTEFGKIKLYRHRQDENLANPAASSPERKLIIIYDSIAQYNMERVIAHEMAHFLYLNLSVQEQISYKKVAKWKKRNIEGAIKETTTRKNFVADDCDHSPDEDFANNIEYYLYGKKTLKQKNPKIYQWIKKFLEENKK